MSEQSLSPDEATGAEGLPPDADVSRETEGGGEHESEARKVGWREKDEFVAKGGREGDWVPADQFLQKSQETAKARRLENQRLEKRLAARDAEIDAVKRENAEIKAALAEQNKSRGEITEQALLAQRRAAMQAGDADEFDRLDTELWKLRRTTSAAPQQQQPRPIDARIKAALDDFAEENPVYQRPEMQELLALGVKAVRDVNPGLSVEDSLRKGHDYARRIYSDQYTTTNGTKRPAMAETGGTPARSGSDTKQWSDLKPEARKALEDHVLSAPTYTKMKPEQLAQAKARMVKEASPDMFKGR